MATKARPGEAAIRVMKDEASAAAIRIGSKPACKRVKFVIIIAELDGCTAAPPHGHEAVRQEALQGSVVDADTSAMATDSMPTGWSIGSPDFPWRGEGTRRFA